MTPFDGRGDGDELRDVGGSEIGFRNWASYPSVICGNSVQQCVALRLHLARVCRMRRWTSRDAVARGWAWRVTRDPCWVWWCGRGRDGWGAAERAPRSAPARGSSLGRPDPPPPVSPPLARAGGVVQRRAARDTARAKEGGGSTWRAKECHTRAPCMRKAATPTRRRRGESHARASGGRGWRCIGRALPRSSGGDTTAAHRS